MDDCIEGLGGGCGDVGNNVSDMDETIGRAVLPDGGDDDAVGAVTRGLGEGYAQRSGERDGDVGRVKRGFLDKVDVRAQNGASSEG